MSAAQTTQTTEIQNWKIETHNEEPRVLDLILAEKLGFAQARDIRKVIKRMVEDGRLSAEILQRATAARIEMKSGVFRNQEVQEYLLTEEEALLVTTQSRTPKAKEILKEVVRVFVAYRRGQLAPVSLPSSQTENAQIAALAASVAQLTGAVASLVSLVQQTNQAPVSLPSSQTRRAKTPAPQRALPLRPPADDQSRWYWPSEIAYRLGISVGDVWHHARELQIDGSIYQRNQRQSNNKIGSQFHQWAANEIARRVNQFRRPNG